MKAALTTIPYTTKAMVFGVLPVPQHLEVIGTHAVRRESDWASGCLVRNKNTGFYSIWSCNTLISVDQDAAKAYAENHKEV